jgi:hypothetical protein
MNLLQQEPSEASLASAPETLSIYKRGIVSGARGLGIDDSGRIARLRVYDERDRESNRRHERVTQHRVPK